VTVLDPEPFGSDVVPLTNLKPVIRIVATAPAIGLELVTVTEVFPLASVNVVAEVVEAGVTFAEA